MTAYSTEWEPWFAWFPVSVGGGPFWWASWRWGVWVERRWAPAPDLVRQYRDI